MCYELRELTPQDKSDKVAVKRHMELTNNMMQFVMGNMEVEMNVMVAKLAIQTYHLPFGPHTGGDTFEDFFNRYGKYLIDSRS